jgi:hypothetical protein
MSAPRRRNEPDRASMDAPLWARRAKPAAPHDVKAPRFVGDRAMIELRQRLALDPEAAPQPPHNNAGRSVDRLAFRFCAVAAVAALVAWGVVSYSRVRLPANEARQARVVHAIAVSKVKPVQAHAAAAAAAEHQALAPIETPAVPQVALAVEEKTPAPPIAMPLWLQQSGISITAKTPEPAPPPLASSSVVAGKPVLNADEIATLIKRGKAFMNDGDVAAARLLLQRAAEAGSADAALALGASFDPLIIKQAGAIGVQTDAAEARHWYQQAAALGSDAASKQLAKLASAGQ